MMLSLLSAFALPRRATDLSGTSLQAILIPISRPTYKIASAIRGRTSAQPMQDDRASRTIEQENLALKYQILRMTSEIDQLQERAGERASLGGFESFCDRFEVTAADAPPREGITVTGSGVGSLQLDQAVLSSGSAISLIGRVNRMGALAAHVRLISDPGFAVTGHFVSYSTSDGAHNQDLPALVKGRGEGEMMIDNLPMEDVQKAGLKSGDWVVLSDESFPRELQGIRIGRIESIQPLPKQPLFALIQLSPEQNLSHPPSDVWIMTHHR